MQIKQFEAPSFLPTLDALDAEFGYENAQCTAGRGRQGDAPMNARFTPLQSEFPTPLRAAGSTVNATKRNATTMRPSLARRALRRLARLFIVFCVGVGTLLAWQSYGDAARVMIANSSPQLSWLVRQTEPVLPTAPDVGAGGASSDLQQLALGLAAVRLSVDQLTAHLAASQRQMGGDIAKLHADEQEILRKLSVPPPRPTAAPAQKPASVTPPPSAPVQAR